jgi:hypothetical protein
VFTLNLACAVRRTKPRRLCCLNGGNCPVCAISPPSCLDGRAITRVPNTRVHISQANSAVSARTKWMGRKGLTRGLLRIWLPSQIVKVSVVLQRLLYDLHQFINQQLPARPLSPEKASKLDFGARNLALKFPSVASFLLLTTLSAFPVCSVWLAEIIGSDNGNPIALALSI